MFDGEICCRLGLNSLLSEVISLPSDKDSRRSSREDDSGDEFRRQDSEDDTNDEDFTTKADTAIDYSDINELAEDLPVAIEPTENKSQPGDDYDIEDAIPANKVTVDGVSAEAVKTEDGKASENGTSASNSSMSADDKTLMPPPSLPQKSGSGEGDQEVKPEVKEEKTDATTEKKLDTPLAAMLPSKYANVDVRDLFPDFRPDKVLRFSRLFGPGKPSSLPQIWRSVRKRRRKRKQSRDGIKREGSDSTSDTDEPKKYRGWNLHFAPSPTKEELCSDDEEKLLSEITDAMTEKSPETGEAGDNKPKVADWRYGPAQVWYDMLEVPDSGEGFNYGFRMKEDPQQKEEIEINGDPIPDDAYLMVSQLHWEDDVVWDGNDIKHKVMQKLNSKTNAAGWLPSSGSRTAGAFSHTGKVLPVSTPLQGAKSGISQSGKMTKSQM